MPLDSRGVDLGGLLVSSLLPRELVRPDGNGRARMRLRRGIAIAVVAGGVSPRRCSSVWSRTPCPRRRTGQPGSDGCRNTPGCRSSCSGWSSPGSLRCSQSDIGSSDSNAEPLVRSMTVPGRRGPRSCCGRAARPRCLHRPGRELDLLRRSVEASQASGEALPVHVIDWMPGVGKTAFAVHAGHALAGRFPDGSCREAERVYVGAESGAGDGGADSEGDIRVLPVNSDSREVENGTGAFGLRCPGPAGGRAVAGFVRAQGTECVGQGGDAS